MIHLNTPHNWKITKKGTECTLMIEECLKKSFTSLNNSSHNKTIHLHTWIDQWRNNNPNKIVRCIRQKFYNLEKDKYDKVEY